MMGEVGRNGLGFTAGTLIGALGGLIGLGGAEFRLPVLIGVFRIGTLEAVILNKAMSLAVVTAALFFRGGTISPALLADHIDVALNLLAGSLVGAWWAAGRAITMPRRWLNRIVAAFLIALAFLMLSEVIAGQHEGGTPLFTVSLWLFAAGTLARLAIGVVAAFLGVAGGELLIPAIVLLYGLDVKLAGSLSLLVSLPTMIVSFVRYSSADAFGVLLQERSLTGCMVAGSILGAAIGGLFLGLFPTHWLLGILGLVLLLAAIKTFQHAH